MPAPLSRDDVLAILDWYQAAGVDAAVGDVSVDWLGRGPEAPGAGFSISDEGAKGSPVAEPQRPQPVPSKAAVSPPSRPRSATPLGLQNAENNARPIAQGASSLAVLEEALASFDGCGLKTTATRLCFYRGAPKAQLMIIGEAPGRDEDLQGKPFVGRAGQLLDKMLAAIGHSEANVHITNIVYWRPPGNRTPTPQEALACRPFLERQIELVEPTIIAAVGGAAAKELLGVSEGIMRLRGKWRSLDIQGRSIPVMATLHPAYLLRTPAAKALAWADLQAIKAKL